MNPDDPTYDDDDVLGPEAVIPGEDAVPDAAERARARVFAELIDKMMTGRTPAAVPSEEQPLLEVATAIRATVRPMELASGRQRSIIESALATAIDRRGGGAAPSVPSMPVVTAPAVVPIDRAAARRRRAVPWIVAAATSAVAAAAVVMLMLDRAPTPTPPAPVATELPFDQRSRPADALVGAIARDRADDAVTRIDAIYADRLGGFRDRSLYGGAP